MAAVKCPKCCEMLQWRSKQFPGRASGEQRDVRKRETRAPRPAADRGCCSAPVCEAGEINRKYGRVVGLYEW